MGFGDGRGNFFFLGGGYEVVDGIELRVSDGRIPDTLGDVRADLLERLAQRELADHRATVFFWKRTSRRRAEGLTPMRGPPERRILFF